MSGGSFDYLCYKACFPGELMVVTGTMREMACALRALPAGGEAADETLGLAVLLDMIAKVVGAEAEALEDVWRAVEWWRSNDTSEEFAVAAIARYNAKRAAS